jgi:serine/threonine protein kinase
MVTPLTPDDPASLGGFRLAGRLGEGGQGVVYLAHPPSGEPVAIKLLSTGDKETRARLARELDALESIASFCTARVLDVSTEGQRPFVVSEFVDGPSLADRVRERGPLTGGDLERLVVGTATALAAIHAAGVVHRDFKPANVLLGPDGPRVVDFGIARAEGAATMTSGLIGTPAYLSPEQIGGSPAAAASDVFAWAATMMYAATGRSPFGADTVPAVLHRVLHAEPDLSPLPPRLRGLIASGLSKDPARRPTAQGLMVSLLNPNVRPAQGTPQAGPFPGDGRTGPQGPASSTAATRASASRRKLVGIVATVALAAAAVTLVMSGGSLLRAIRTPETVTGHATTTPPTQPQTEPQTQTQTQPQTQPQTPAADSPEPSTGGGEKPKIPAAFAGNWSGHTISTNPLDSDGADNTVRLTTGASTAAWTEKDANDTQCRAAISLTVVEPRKLTFSLGANEGGCIAGTVWLELKGDTLAYTWRDEPGPGLVTQTGDLKKS